MWYQVQLTKSLYYCIRCKADTISSWHYSLYSLWSRCQIWIEREWFCQKVSWLSLASTREPFKPVTGTILRTKLELREECSTIIFGKPPMHRHYMYNLPLALRLRLIRLINFWTIFFSPRWWQHLSVLPWWRCSWLAQELLCQPVSKELLVTYIIWTVESWIMLYHA